MYYALTLVVGQLVIFNCLMLHRPTKKSQHVLDVTSVEIKDLANWAQAQPNDYCVMLIA